MAINTDAQLLEPGDAVRLYEVDSTHLGGDVMRFHGHMQNGTIIWQGQAYDPISTGTKGLDLNGDGRPALPPRPLQSPMQCLSPPAPAGLRRRESRT
ncbi:hypothetical protein [Pseudomonas gessardii]|nr:hypothetical protein [Pseudomonas gessardii]NNA97284.1 hypothetical protein [Pseudomonas gessardii]